MESVATEGKSKGAMFGIPALILGVLALALALIHFYAGPFGPPPSAGKVIAEKEIKMGGAVIGKVKIGETDASRQQPKLNTDRIVALSTAAAGFLAVVLAVVAYIRREDKRISGSAVALGAAALAFQFLVIALCMVVAALVISSLFSNLIEVS
jgi:hypothetical protein